MNESYKWDQHALPMLQRGERHAPASFQAEGVAWGCVCPPTHTCPVVLKLLVPTGGGKAGEPGTSIIIGGKL
jgi:hypothetical protein